MIRYSTYARVGVKVFSVRRVYGLVYVSQQNGASNTKNNLSNLNVVPKKSLGQNFVVRDDILCRITDATNLKPDQIVLEVGPGAQG